MSNNQQTTEATTRWTSEYVSCMSDECVPELTDEQRAESVQPVVELAVVDRLQRHTLAGRRRQLDDPASRRRLRVSIDIDTNWIPWTMWRTSTKVTEAEARWMNNKLMQYSKQKSASLLPPIESLSRYNKSVNKRA